MAFENVNAGMQLTCEEEVDRQAAVGCGPQVAGQPAAGLTVRLLLDWTCSVCAVPAVQGPEPPCLSGCHAAMPQGTPWKASSAKLLQQQPVFSNAEL